MNRPEKSGSPFRSRENRKPYGKSEFPAGKSSGFRKAGNSRFQKKQSAGRTTEEFHKKAQNAVSFSGQNPDRRKTLGRKKNLPSGNPAAKTGTTTVKKWGINGEGVGYRNKKAVFIEGAIPKEEVRYTIVEDHDTWARARCDEVLTPSARRRKPPCAYAQDCGGCSIMHLDYKGQVRMKQKILEDALRKYAGYEGPIEPLMKNPSPMMFRNSCKLPFGIETDPQTGRQTVATGMYARNSNRFVGLPRCLVHSRLLEKTRQEITRKIAPYNLPVYSRDRHGLMTLVLREFDGRVHAVLVTDEMVIPDELVNSLLTGPEAVSSVWQSIKKPEDPAYELFGEKILHLGGEPHMEFTLNDLSLTMLPRSFFQLNTLQASNLYNLVAEWAQKLHPALAVEAYCGIGTMSLMAAPFAKRVVGIEAVEDAVINARENALANGIDNASFICGDAGTELEHLASGNPGGIDLLIVDPPRTGLDAQMIESIGKAKPKDMIYVSCNPSTLGKNLKDLQQEYRIEKVQPVDMFSQTPQVETVVLLKRKDLQSSPVQRSSKFNAA